MYLVHEFQYCVPRSLQEFHHYWLKVKKIFPQKPLFLHSGLSKVIEFGGNREPVYDFLLVINSNIGPNLHHF